MNENAPKTERRLFSIGHSNHPMETFLDLLRMYQIEVLVDARSHPYSKYAPHFDTQTLKTAINEAGIKYFFLGKELGGRPEGTEFYDAEGRVIYSHVAESPIFLEGIRRLEQGVQKYRIAIMCSEEDPSCCHRRLLIGRVLSARGIVLDHIRGDSRLQTEVDLSNEEERRRCGDNQMSLFEKTEDKVWRSIRSVSQKKRQVSSSEH